MRIKELTDEQLVKKEAKVRGGLVVEARSLNRNTSDYEKRWRAWFMLREAGIGRGLFKFLAVTRNDL